MNVIYTTILITILSVVGALPNPVITTAAKGMSLLGPVFKAEALVQSAALGAIGGVDKESIVQQITEEKTKNSVLIYTYSLSPFSSEAVKILEETGYEFKNIELGAEWFLLGPEESVTRVALSEEVENGATSLPKVFIGGQCIGGCSDLADLVESGELDVLLSNAKSRKVGGAENKNLFSFFK